jgi:GTPase KRas protein
MLAVSNAADYKMYTPLLHLRIIDGEGFILVYSLSSWSSFASITRLHNRVQRIKEFRSPFGGVMSAALNPQFYPVMLVGNKVDLEAKREVSTQEGLALAQKLGCGFVETSRNCPNVEKAFYDVVRFIRQQ